jgi:hypothetical protein
VRKEERQRKTSVGYHENDKLHGVQKVLSPIPSRCVRLLTGILISSNIEDNSWR